MAFLERPSTPILLRQNRLGKKAASILGRKKNFRISTCGIRPFLKPTLIWDPMRSGKENIYSIEQNQISSSPKNTASLWKSFRNTVTSLGNEFGRPHV